MHNAHVIEDEKKQFTFPTLVGDKRGLIVYEEALNKLSEENERLKQQNESLKDTNKSLTAQLAHGVEFVIGDSE